MVIVVLELSVTIFLTSTSTPFFHPVSPPLLLSSAKDEVDDGSKQTDLSTDEEHLSPLILVRIHISVGARSATRLDRKEEEEEEEEEIKKEGERNETKEEAGKEENVN